MKNASNKISLSIQNTISFNSYQSTGKVKFQPKGSSKRNSSAFTPQSLKKHIIIQAISMKTLIFVLIILTLSQAGQTDTNTASSSSTDSVFAQVNLAQLLKSLNMTEADFKKMQDQINKNNQPATTSQQSTEGSSQATTSTEKTSIQGQSNNGASSASSSSAPSTDQGFVDLSAFQQKLGLTGKSGASTQKNSTVPTNQAENIPKPTQNSSPVAEKAQTTNSPPPSQKPATDISATTSNSASSTIATTISNSVIPMQGLLPLNMLGSGTSFSTSSSTNAFDLLDLSDLQRKLGLIPTTAPPPPQPQQSNNSPSSSKDQSNNSSTNQKTQNTTSGQNTQGQPSTSSTKETGTQNIGSTNIGTSAQAGQKSSIIQPATPKSQVLPSNPSPSSAIPPQSTSSSPSTAPIPSISSSTSPPSSFTSSAQPAPVTQPTTAPSSAQSASSSPSSQPAPAPSSVQPTPTPSLSSSDNSKTDKLMSDLAALQKMLQQLSNNQSSSDSQSSSKNTSSSQKTSSPNSPTTAQTTSLPTSQKDNPPANINSNILQPPNASQPLLPTTAASPSATTQKSQSLSQAPPPLDPSMPQMIDLTKANVIYSIYNQTKDNTSQTQTTPTTPTTQKQSTTNNQVIENKQTLPKQQAQLAQPTQLPQPIQPVEVIQKNQPSQPQYTQPAQTSYTQNTQPTQIIYPTQTAQANTQSQTSSQSNYAGSQPSSYIQPQPQPQQKQTPPKAIPILIYDNSQKQQSPQPSKQPSTPLTITPDNNLNSVTLDVAASVNSKTTDQQTNVPTKVVVVVPSSQSIQNRNTPTIDTTSTKIYSQTVPSQYVPPISSNTNIQNNQPTANINTDTNNAAAPDSNWPYSDYMASFIAASSKSRLDPKYQTQAQNNQPQTSSTPAQPQQQQPSNGNFNQAFSSTIINQPVFQPTQSQQLVKAQPTQIINPVPSIQNNNYYNYQLTPPVIKPSSNLQKQTPPIQSYQKLSSSKVAIYSLTSSYKTFSSSYIVPINDPNLPILQLFLSKNYGTYLNDGKLTSAFKHYNDYDDSLQYQLIIQSSYGTFNAFLDYQLISQKITLKSLAVVNFNILELDLSNCATASSSEDHCQVCKVGYRNFMGRCKQLDQGCLQYVTDECGVCNQGYDLIKGRCCK